MPLSPEEREQAERFGETYLRYQTPVMRSLERSVCGCDYGGTSWTTKDEADRIAGLLNLRPGLRLLDVGSGSGWPALYWADKCGCDVMLTDLPFDGLRIAAARIKRDKPPGACWLAVADGAGLPFADGGFEAISHSDVLCCLLDKAGALRSCRRVLGADGHMVFTVISISPGLSEGDCRLALEAGPPYVAAENDYPALLDVTGWDIVEQIDVTANFAETIRRLIQTERRERAAMSTLYDEETLAERAAGHLVKLNALEKRLLRREIFKVAARD
ncbi:MAG: class I SAM-dependent methyltransferase [Alphaproteobacteria bacterium]|jgi:ubiquinone/menaquinone biosynthesis C-methylase UbiE